MVNTIEYDTWRQIALLDDLARGRRGACRSEAPDSPFGREVWLSDAARRANSRTADLAEGWCRLAAMRQECLKHGGEDDDFVRQALSDTRLRHLYAFILTVYWGYRL